MAQRLRGLDGLRGIAVAAVVLYHFDVPWIPGGFLGVDIFFVISGFIITTLLLEEAEREQQIRLRTFYARRARRLLPTLLAMMCLAVIACGFWATDASASLRSDIPWALAFGVNWSAIAMQRSYFVAMSRPPILEHLWSLAIEEQFYIVWPGVLLVLLRFRSTLAQSWVTLRGLVFFVSTVGAAGSTWRMHSVALAAGMPVPTDPTRAYFGTDTHSMSLLAGCAVAALWHREQSAQRLAPRTARVWDLLGIAALISIVSTMVLCTELTAVLYHGGFLIFALLVAVIVVQSTHTGLPMAWRLRRRPLTWLGDRSYSLYLWHWPVAVLLRPEIDTPLSNGQLFVLRTALVLGLSQVSYHFIEKPVRNGALGRIACRVRTLATHARTNFHEAALAVVRPRQLASLTLIAALAGVLVAGGVAVWRAPSAQRYGISELGGLTEIDEDPLPTVDATKSVTHRPNTYIKTVVFGDSVVLSGRDALRAAIDGLALDAKVGRQPSEIAAHIRHRRATGRLGQDIVIHMGTNGVVRREDLAPILDLLTDRRRVVVVNVHVPRVWAKPTNDMIASIVKDYPNVRMVDWNTASMGHRRYFARDGFHLSAAGGRVFAGLINDALAAP